MRLRAITQINSALGTWPPGQTLVVPDEVGRAWIEARIAEEASAAPADDAPGKPLHRMNKAELAEIAESLGLDAGGSNKDLVARIAAAREAGAGDDEDDDTESGDA